jgi:hypothetical protein
MSKPAPARYRTTNWSSYTASLCKRGSLLIWLDKGMTWLAPHDGKPGRPAVFSDAAIQFCLTIKVLFKLPHRYHRPTSHRDHPDPRRPHHPLQSTRHRRDHPRGITSKGKVELTPKASVLQQRLLDCFLMQINVGPVTGC